jgi:putative transposase
MRPPRISGFSYIGLRRYSLTICAYGRLSHFACGETVSVGLEQFRHSAAQHDFKILAYCFMPDHLHVVSEGCSADSDFVAFVHDAKQGSGYAFKHETGRRLWQDGYFDRVLRDEDSVLAVVRYVLSNPIRAGLAREIGDYPFCGSDVYSMDEVRACAEMWDPSRPGAVTRRH